MEMSFEEMEQKLRTYTTGYYAGKKVEWDLLRNAATSYYVPRMGKIFISYSTIAEGYKTIPEDMDPEVYIRTTFYHELSHAILTPPDLTIDRTMNIFEDERIETLLSNYYMNVNFKRSVKLLNNWKPGQVALDAESAFYNLVRYRECDSEEFLQRVIDLIVKWKILRNEWRDLRDYTNDVHTLHDEFIEWWNKNQQTIQENSADDSAEEDRDEDIPQDNEDNSQEQEDTSTESQDNENEDDQDEEDKEDDNQPDTDNQDEEVESNEVIASSYEGEEDEDEMEDDNPQIFTPSEQEEIIAGAFINQDRNLTIEKEVKACLEKAKKAKRISGEIYNSYSGKVDPRSCGRDDYRYFRRTTDQGKGGALSNIKLNLFIDCSGSFGGNAQTVNAILKSLEEVEKFEKRFSFDVVKLDMSATLCEKDHRRIWCSGSNRVVKGLIKIYRSIQDRSAHNVNIVLFDGDCVSGTRYGQEEADLANLKVFDNNSTILISDYSNKGYFDTGCSGAKQIIYTRDYVNELQANLIKSLGILL